MKMEPKTSLPKWLTLMNTVKIILLVFSVTIVGCDKDDDDHSDNEISETDLCLVEVDDDFTELEIDAPVYLDGGAEGMIANLYDVISYPAEARENGIEGLCVLNFEITETGTVENIIAIENPGGGIDEASIVSLQSITEGVSFSVAMLNGNLVRVKKGLQIRYRLE